jgi:hypothetical protein
MMLLKPIQREKTDMESIRSIDETLDFLRMASQVTAKRLECLLKGDPDNALIERVRQRQLLIEETIKAVEEANG